MQFFCQAFSFCLPKTEEKTGGKTLIPDEFDPSYAPKKNGGGNKESGSSKDVKNMEKGGYASLDNVRNEKELQTVDVKTKTLNSSGFDKPTQDNTISPPIKNSHDADSNPLSRSKIGGNHRESSANKEKTQDNTMTFGNQSGMNDEEKQGGKNVLDSKGSPKKSDNQSNKKEETPAKKGANVPAGKLNVNGVSTATYGYSKKPNPVVANNSTKKESANSTPNRGARPRPSKTPVLRK